MHRQLRELGQSLWLDNISRDLLDSGTLQRYIDEWSITGLTSNPTIFDEAIGGSAAYDGAIRDHARGPLSDEELGALAQRLLWASTGTKDPEVSDCLYVDALAAPDTIDTIPEKTLRALAGHGRNLAPMAADGVAALATLARFREAGVDIDALARRLQLEGAQSFAKSWRRLLDRVAAKRKSIAA